MRLPPVFCQQVQTAARVRSEEHTSELQSPCNLVCRLLLEKKKKKITHAVRDGQASRLVCAVVADGGSFDRMMLLNVEYVRLYVVSRVITRVVHYITPCDA